MIAPEPDSTRDSTETPKRASAGVVRLLARFGARCALHRISAAMHRLHGRDWRAACALRDLLGRHSLHFRACLCRLGTPFAHDFGPGMLSPAAIADPPRFDSARAVAIHEGVAKAMVARLKYGERLDLARAMARLMVQAGGPLLASAEVLIPVPMHRGRLWRRRYNQAALLANEIGALAGKPILLDTLRRVKRTPPQVGLTRNERRSNLAGAFRIEPGQKAAIEGRHCLVIDDVRTTGSTLNACAHILRQAGAARIDVLTFTLVPDGA